MSTTNLFAKLTKFRELDMDKIVFNNEGHSIESPSTVTVTSIMPTPRKGNPGAIKTSFNIRRTVTLDAGTPTERSAPIVVKMETSFPLGATAFDKQATLYDLAKLCAVDGDPEMEGLLYSGIIPKY